MRLGCDLRTHAAQRFHWRIAWIWMFEVLKREYVASDNVKPDISNMCSNLSCAQYPRKKIGSCGILIYVVVVRVLELTIINPQFAMAKSWTEQEHERFGETSAKTDRIPSHVFAICLDEFLIQGGEINKLGKNESKPSRLSRKFVEWYLLSPTNSRARYVGLYCVTQCHSNGT